MVNRPDINTIVNEQDFSVLYRWSVVFPLTGNPKDKFLSKIKGNDKSLSFLALTSDLPRFTNEEIEVGISRHKFYQGGIRRYDPVTLTFVENDKSVIQDFIATWVGLISSPIAGFRGKKEQYVKNVKLFLLRPDDSISTLYTLHNSWIVSHNIGRLDGSSNTILQPEIVLRYDYFEMEKIDS